MILRRFTLAAAAAALLLAPAAHAQIDRAREPVPVLRVNGEAEVSAEPDIATFTVGVEVRDPSASKAMAEAGRISDAIIAALRALGIPREDIQTARLTLYDTQEPEGPEPAPRENFPPRFRRVYIATHTLQVEVGKDRFDRIGEILDAAMKVGANQVGNVSFGIEDETALRKEGLARAVRNAREKAEIMASAAGVRLAGVITLQEGFIARPMPYFESGVMASRMAADAPSPVPPSEIKRTYQVTVEYRITQ